MWSYENISALLPLWIVKSPMYCLQKGMQSQIIRNDGQNSFIIELNIINGLWMRLLVDHKQTVNAYLEEVQSLAEAYSKAFSCNNLFFYIEMVGRMPHFSMKQPRPLSNHLKHLKMWYTELKKPHGEHKATTFFETSQAALRRYPTKPRKTGKINCFWGAESLTWMLHNENSPACSID